jgi:hypothetical protein
LFLGVSFNAAAQYSGPAVDTCLSYASKEIKQKVVFDRDASLVIERYTRKAGSQFVSSLLLGNGAIVYPGGVPVEMSFVCLLADEKRAVFFNWLPRRDAPVLAQCRRASGPAECLEALLQVAEQDLIQLYAKHFVDARQADSAAGNEERLISFRKSADTWKAYRDAECARRGAGEAHKACMVELTRRRALDLR